jgi:hypothetical protein
MLNLPPQLNITKLNQKLLCNVFSFNTQIPHPILSLFPPHNPFILFSILTVILPQVHMLLVCSFHNMLQLHLRHHPPPIPPLDPIPTLLPIPQNLRQPHHRLPLRNPLKRLTGLLIRTAYPEFPQPLSELLLGYGRAEGSRQGLIRDAREGGEWVGEWGCECEF